MNAPCDCSALSRQVAELCVRQPAGASPALLAHQLGTLAPGLVFREVLARGGWYRLGGVIDGSGQRIADDIERWAGEELAARGDDLQALCEDMLAAELGLRATRLAGRTHYFVAACGPGAADFVQIEIEELQEMVGHALFSGEASPGSLEELIDPRASAAPSTPLGPPLLALRRVTAMADFLARLRAQRPEPAPIHRFIAAWEASSAGQASQFSNHWVLAVREHLDRYRQPVLQASPVLALTGPAPRFSAEFGLGGLALHEALQRFDRTVGYPMAWFFHMIATRGVPHALASAVIDDLQAGFHYLPDRDAALVKDWLYRPYSF